MKELRKELPYGQIILYIHKYILCIDAQGMLLHAIWGSLLNDASALKEISLVAFCS